MLNKEEDDATEQDEKQFDDNEENKEDKDENDVEKNEREDEEIEKSALNNPLPLRIIPKCRGNVPPRCEYFYTLF